MFWCFWLFGSFCFLFDSFQMLFFNLWCVTLISLQPIRIQPLPAVAMFRWDPIPRPGKISSNWRSSQLSFLSWSKSWCDHFWVNCPSDSISFKDLQSHFLLSFFRKSLRVGPVWLPPSRWEPCFQITKMVCEYFMNSWLFSNSIVLIYGILWLYWWWIMVV